jgi:hypothetical protein
LKNRASFINRKKVGNSLAKHSSLRALRLCEKLPLNYEVLFLAKAQSSQRETVIWKMKLAKNQKAL